jgi:hypothetical protein
MTYKDIILDYLFDYLKLKKIDCKKSGKIVMLECPFCNGKANIIPNTSNIHCFICKKNYSFIDIIKKIEPEKENLSEEEILQYIKKLFNIKVNTKKDNETLNKVLDGYVKAQFNLVPIAKNAKNPVEKDWTNKDHYDKNEWLNWLNNGLNIGVKTGRKSNITVIDIDTKEIPEILKGVDTLIQTTKKGYHYFFQYEEDLPKSRIDEFKIDIENDGGQVVIFPSIVENVERTFKGDTILKMSPEIRKFFTDRVTVTRKTNSELVKENIETGNFQIDLFKEGSRSNDMTRIGGVLRKTLSPSDTRQVLHILNSHNTKPLDYKEIEAMCSSLERYNVNDDQELAHKILEYLKLVESATKTDIEIVVTGNLAKGELKKKVGKLLTSLTKEQYIMRRGRYYHLIKKAEWNESLINVGIPINFKMPYFHDVAVFNWGDLILIGSKAKYGKCHAKGTKILMYNGSLKNVEDILPKDKVMGIDSKSREVIDICTGREQMYEIISNKNDKFVVNGNHILSLKNPFTEKIVNISVKDFLSCNNTFRKIHKLYRVPIEFPEKYIPVDPYFLGLWLGDGDSRGVRITNKDKEIINYLLKYAKICKQDLVEYKYVNRCPSYAIVCKNHKNFIPDSLHIRMKNLNLFKNKHIPFIYKTNSRRHRLELLAGLIDSDGTCNHKKTGYDLVTKSKQLKDDIVYLCRSLGFLVYVKEKIAKLKSRNYKCKVYRISIMGKCHEIPVKVKRKKAIKRKRWTNHLLTPFKIKKTKIDNYYGFTLNGDQLYMLDNFIVNHNTHLGMNIIKRLVEQGVKPYYVSLETGSRFTKIALQLGLKEGDFKHTFCADPTQIELEKNAVTIIDWLLVIDKAKTDLVFRHFIEQLDKNKGLLIIFQQLKHDGSWFAPNMCKQFPSLATRYLYENDNDGTYGKFTIEEVREPTNYGKKTFELPCIYNWKTKELNRLDESKEKQNEA